MPRSRTGQSDNAVEAGHNIIHGAGEVKSDRVDRAEKTAPLLMLEKGAGLEGMNASGGGSSGLTQGQGASHGGWQNAAKDMVATK